MLYFRRPMEELSARHETSSAAERTPLPLTPPLRADGATDRRLVDAWCEWLCALATDAEAAMAAAIAYGELSASSRDQWLDALEQDAMRVQVPKIAVYAPLLAVETDPDRRDRMALAIAADAMDVTPRFPARGLKGKARDGSYVALLVTPLYLDFAQVLACSYRPDHGFFWVRHDPIVRHAQVALEGDKLEGVLLEGTPLKSLIDDLALAVLAQRRAGREIPEALRAFADLFGPGVGDSSP
jgi:hypothetical protein